jgi:hypothetical protein
LTLTADHGSTPLPSVSGATVISQGKLAGSIEAEFDRDGDGVPLVDQVQPTQVFVDERELAQEGSTLSDVAEFIMSVTKGQVADDTWPTSVAERAATAFPAAFPAALLERLPCLAGR